MDTTAKVGPKIIQTKYTQTIAYFIFASQS